ncbi:MAG: phosphatase domain-containing protein [Myxococcota bacterium]
MPPVIRSAPSPTKFADAWAKEVVKPAAEALVGADGRLDAQEAANTGNLTGNEKLASEALQRLASVTGSQAPTVADVVAAERARALEAAEGAAGANKRLSWVEARALPADLSAGYSALRGRAAEAEPALRYSERVLDDVVTTHGVDAQALLEKAREFDNGNHYLTRAELERAAQALKGGNDVGIVSDIDKTILPPEVNGTMLPPYPGVAALFREIEALDGAPGDTTYVTARNPERARPVVAWLDTHGMPAGTIETGTSAVPWVAEPEKIRDITATLNASPGKKFVLVGDTSHRDPEVYRQIKDAFPDRILAVVIHKQRGSLQPARFEGQHLVENYADAAARLFKSGVISEDAARRVIASARAEGLSLTDADVERMLQPG